MAPEESDHSSKAAALNQEKSRLRQDEEILLAQDRISGHASSLRRILALVTDHRRTLSCILASSLILSLLGLATPRFTQIIMDRVLPQEDLSLLTYLVLALILFTAFQIILTVWRRFTLVDMSLKFDRILLGAFAAHLLALPPQFFKSRQAGDLVSRFNEHGSVRHLFAGGLTRAVIDAVFVLIYLTVMFLYSVQLAAIVSALLILFTGFTLFTGPILKRQHRRLQEDKATVESELIEAIANIDVVKSMGLEETIRQKWQVLFRVFSISNYRAQKLRQLLESSCTGIQFLITITLLWFGANLVIQGELSLGQLVAFYMYTSLALPPLLSLVTLWDEWQQARVALERIQEILDHKPEPQPPVQERISLERVRGQVCFERVFFSYGDSVPVLRGVSFELRAGECVALIGKSGSGKTTVARLLLGLYRPNQGRVLIDGVDLQHLDLQTYRRQAGVVLQENLLLCGSIRGNITLGDPDPDFERVREAARRAGAHDFISRLPQAYDTVVGEMGLTLSAGERQRISIARALYRNPRLLIFDEATSALDGFTEWEIHQRLQGILKGRTTLLIAHKMATIKIADRILVLKDGIMIEQGTHEELLARRGTYHALADQAFQE